MKSILVVGDSYAYGQGCADRQGSCDRWGGPSALCWPALIQRCFDIPVTNLSLYGTDNLSIFTRIKNHCYSDYDLIIYAGTSHSRMQVRDPVNSRATRTILASYTPQWAVPNSQLYDHAHQQYFKYFYSDSVGRNTATATVLAAWALCEIAQSKFLFSFPGTQPQDTVLSRIGQHRFVSCADGNYSADQLAECGHPNELGQLAYFESIIKPRITNLL